MIDYQPYVDRVDALVTGRPGTVIVAFLLVTVLFGFGVGNVSTSAGTEQFTEDVPAQEALDEVNAKFTPTFGTGGGSTQLIQRSENVLSRDAMARMLEVQERMRERPGMRVESTSSAAAIVARQLDPGAETPAAQRRAIEGATDGEIRQAVRDADDSNPQIGRAHV